MEKINIGDNLLIAIIWVAGMIAVTLSVIFGIK
jgi:hypothetical protein